MDFVTTARNHIRAGYQSLAVSTTELQRCEEDICSILTRYPGEYQAVLSWDCISGFTVIARDPGFKLPADCAMESHPGGPETARVDLALAYLSSDGFPLSHCVVIFRNLHAFLREATAVQMWQNCFRLNSFNSVRRVEAKRKQGESREDFEDRKDEGELVECVRVPIIVGTNVEFSESIQPTITKLEYGLPTLEEQTEVFADFLRRLLQDNPNVALPNQDRQEAICRSLLGMTAKEADDVLSLCAVTHGSLAKDECLETIEDQKAGILKRNTSLTYIHRSKIRNASDVGGWTAYKAWMATRRRCYSPEAAELGIDLPKGVAIIGCPGTGKSMVGKVTAKLLDLPLVILDIASVFGSLIGQSEQAIRDALRTIVAMQGVVVLIDEVDKIWSGVNGASGDSGVAKRVFGSFLTWMAEKTDPSFIIMTMNRPDGLPPELFRAGRLDAVWSTDLPDLDERREILEIHLRNRHVDVAKLAANEDDWANLLQATNDCVGSELEAIVVSARMRAFEVRGNGTPTLAELEQEAGKLVKLAVMDGENLAAIRKFCAERTRPVSTPVKVTQTQKQRRVAAGVRNN
jgi:MoxR-like ATPase